VRPPRSIFEVSFFVLPFHTSCARLLSGLFTFSLSLMAGYFPTRACSLLRVLASDYFQERLALLFFSLPLSLALTPSRPFDCVYWIDVPFLLFSWSRSA